MGYAQYSVRAYRKLLVTVSLTPMPVACGIQGTTQREEEWTWTYAEASPHDLTIPHTNSQQRVPLYRRSSGSSKIMTKGQDSH